MSAGSGASELDHRARKLQGAMLEHPGLTIERMPGLGYVLNQFIGQAPLSLSRLVARLSGRGSIEEVRSTTLFQAVGDCGGLTAAIYKSAPYDSRLLIALDERIDDLIVSSIFGEAVPANPESDPGSKARESRTAIETALLEEFSRALGNALEAAFASVVPLPLAFERLITLSDPFALGRRDGEAAAARFSLEMNGGACECLLLLPQALLLPFRKELANDPEAATAAADGRWARLMEIGVRQARLSVMAVLEDVPMELGEIANLRVGGVLPLQRNDFNAIRLECSGRGMFTCKLGQGDGRYRLEIESPLGQGQEDTA